MEEQMAKDYKEFTDAHPEIETDEQLAEEVLAYVQEFGAISRKNGKILSMKEALTKAWALAGRDDTSEQVAAKAKEIAAKPKVESAKKKVKKQEFTDAQLAVAQKWGANLDSLKTKSS